MTCPSCGKEITGNEKFCGNCGYKFDTKPKKHEKAEKDNTNVPNRFEKKAIKKQLRHDAKIQQKKKEKVEKKLARKKHRKETHFTLKLAIVIVLSLIIVGGSLTALIHFKVIDLSAITTVFNNKERTPNSNDDYIMEKEENNTDESDEYSSAQIDAEKYFENNTKIISKIEVTKSDKVQTEKEALISFENRGFTSAVTYEYDMNGTYSEPTEASANSDKHPEYDTIFFSNNQIIWSVLEINGKIMAVPVSYNNESDTPVVFSETDTLISYDSATNTFFETKPKDIRVITVDRIDAKYINSLSMDKIKELL